MHALDLPHPSSSPFSSRTASALRRSAHEPALEAIPLDGTGYAVISRLDRLVTPGACRHGVAAGAQGRATLLPLVDAAAKASRLPPRATNCRKRSCGHSSQLRPKKKLK
ncbi:hypothetical protein JCM8208_005790 [Rhodotorula glutinis]